MVDFPIVFHSGELWGFIDLLGGTGTWVPFLEQAWLLRLQVRSTQRWPRAMGIIDNVVSGALIVRLTHGAALRAAGWKSIASLLWNMSDQLRFKASHLGDLQQLATLMMWGKRCHGVLADWGADKTGYVTSICSSGGVFLHVVVSRSFRAFSAVPPSLRICHARRGHLLSTYRLKWRWENEGLFWFLCAFLP